jgi:hypothetical protein
MAKPRRVLSLVLILLLAWSGAASAIQIQLDSDLCSDTAGTLLPPHTPASGTWVVLASAAYNKLLCAGTGANAGFRADVGATGNYDTGPVWTANQWAQLTVDGTVTFGGRVIGVVLRWQTGDVNSGYFVGMDNVTVSANYIIELLNAGAKSTLRSTSTAMANSDVLNAQIVGTVITLSVNGSVLTTYDTSGDATKYSTGNPGLLVNATGTTTRMAGSWSAGRVDSTAPATRAYRSPTIRMRTIR